MVTTREQALEMARKARAGLEALYGDRLRGVYLYGSAARDQLTEDSDVDIAVVLDEVARNLTEHQRTSQLGSDISLEHGSVVLFFFAEQADLEAGRFAIHRDIRQEGVLL